MKEIEFCGQSLVLHESGILLWPKHKLAVVADLHFEKGSHYAQAGQFLPPYETLETLKKLEEVLEFSAATTLILLGDTIHDERGYARMDEAVKNRLEILFKKFDTLWIIGNHDGAFVPPLTKAYEDFALDNIIFRHEAEEIEEGKGEVSGHYHPKARLQLKGQKVSRTCFAVSDNRMILPSFGTLTGGLDVTDKALKPILGKNFTTHLCGQKKIYSIPIQ